MGQPGTNAPDQAGKRGGRFPIPNLARRVDRRLARWQAIDLQRALPIVRLARTKRRPRMRLIGLKQTEKHFPWKKLHCPQPGII
jgi:hypothetical protein